MCVYTSSLCVESWCYVYFHLNGCVTACSSSNVLSMFLPVSALNLVLFCRCNQNVNSSILQMYAVVCYCAKIRDQGPKPLMAFSGQQEAFGGETFRFLR